MLLAFVPWLVSMLFMTLLFRLLLYGNKRGWGWAKWLIVEWRWSAVYLAFVFVVHYVSGVCSDIGVFYSLLTLILFIQYEIMLADLYFFHVYNDGAAANNFTGRGTLIRCAMLIPMFVFLSFI